MSVPARREVLALLAGIGGAALAGCVDDGDPSTDSPGTGPRNDPDDADPIQSHLPDESFPSDCPAYETVDRVICYDAIEPADVPAHLEPGTREVGDGDSIDFTLHNDSESVLHSNFYNWRLDKRVEGNWYHVDPMGHDDPLMGIDPGGSHTWTLTVDNGGVEAGGPLPSSSGTEDVTVGGLGGGQYVFRAKGRLEGVDEALAFAATFEYAGDPIELVPSDHVGATAWEGETLVARSTRGDPESDRTRLGAFELRRVDEPGDDTRPIVVEQVLRRPRLRDILALATARDTDHVRLEEYDGAHPIFGLRGNRTYEFRGEYWEASARELA